MSSQDPKSENAPWANAPKGGSRHLLRRAFPWLIGLGIIGLIVWGLSPKPIEVETGEVRYGPLKVTVTEEGKTRIRNRYIVAAPVAGTMSRVTLKAGDDVKAGQTPLTSILPAPVPLLDPRARAQAEAVVSMKENARKQAVETLEAQRAASKLANAELERVRSVQTPGSVSQSERDRTEGDASIKAAQVRASEFSLQVLDAEIAQARAALDRPTSTGQGNLIELRSPVSGKVLKVFQESETVTAPGTQILEVGDPSDLEIEAEILSRDAVSIKPGDPATIEQWGGETSLQGKVRRIEPAAFTKISALGVEEQRVLVLIDFPAHERLGDRFRVEVQVAIWQTERALIAPSGALFREGNLWKTYILRHGVAQMAEIEIGQTNGRFTEIRSGLQSGDVLLVHPPDVVKPGTRVVKRADS